MASLGDLVVRLTANNDQFNRTMKNSQDTLGRFSKAVLALAAGAGGIGILKLAADAETLQVKLRTLLGSGEAAGQMFKDISQFAAETPFQKLDIGNAAQQLLSFNVPAKDVIKSLQMIGDIAAMTGTPIRELAELYGKAQVQGRLMGDDITQITGRGIPIIQELAKQFGVAEKEVKGLVAAGKVTAKHLTIAFESMTTGAGKFAGGMKDLSQTTAGQFSTLKDNIVGVAETMGAVFLPTVNKLLGGLTKVIQTTTSLPQGLARLGAALVAVAVAFKAITVAQAAFTKAAVVAQALSGPKGWAQLAIGLTVAAGAMYVVDSAMADVGAQTEETTQHIERANAALNNTAGAARNSGRDVKQLSDDLKTFEGLVATGPEAFFVKMVEAAKAVRRISSSWEEYENNMRRVVNQQSGFNDTLRQAQDDLALAQGGSAIDQQIQRFRDLGVQEEELATLRKILEQREAITRQQEEEEKRKRDALKLARAQQGLDKFRMSEQIAAARKEVSQTKSRLAATGGAGIAVRGSQEALSTILGASRKVPEQALAEHKKANAKLQKLLDAQRAEKIAEFTQQGAV
jgi:tape measure domain-containing protein